MLQCVDYDGEGFLWLVIVVCWLCAGCCHFLKKIHHKEVKSQGEKLGSCAWCYRCKCHWLFLLSSKLIMWGLRWWYSKTKSEKEVLVLADDALHAITLYDRNMVAFKWKQQKLQQRKIMMNIRFFIYLLFCLRSYLPLRYVSHFFAEKETGTVLRLAKCTQTVNMCWSVMLKIKWL